MAVQAREDATANIAGRLGGPHPDPPPRAGEGAVDVVIVNWNSQSFLRECIAVLDAGSAADTLKVTVVDNASSDGSPDGLGAGRLRVDVVHNNENRGFAAACNQGARLGNARYLLFLNPDVRVGSDAVAAAAGYLDAPAHSGVGIVGIKLLDSEGHVQPSCARAPDPAVMLLRTLFLDRIFPALVPSHFLPAPEHGDTRPVDQVIGAFLMIRRSLFEHLGGFDERFFLYYEDVDLCLAARKAGWSVVHLARARAEHAGGGTTRAVRDVRLCRLANSQVQFMAKHHGRTAAVALMLAILCFELPIRFLHAIVARRDGRWVARATAMFWRSLPGLFRIVMAHSR